MSMIPTREKISITITFAMGMFAGAYLYLTGFATTFEPPESNSEDVYTQFVVTAESFGECKDERSCLTFQVLENGTYRSILQDGSNTVVKEGKIPFSLRRELEDNLTGTALTLNSETKPALDCKYDGTNFRFEVTRDSVEYFIDTCATDVDYESQTWKTLAKLWNHMASLK